MLLARVAVRARTMELLAKAGGFDRSKQEHAFMAGMFSLLGILFGLPLAGILNPLQLSESLASAVLHHDGELGYLLQAVECSEGADETRLIGLLGRLNLSIADYNLLSLDAYRWMLGVIHDQQDAVHA
jgi:EAL and modified HD-GYP domain-containing signal transduction protein